VQECRQRLDSEAAAGPELLSGERLGLLVLLLLQQLLASLLQQVLLPAQQQVLALPVVLVLAWQVWVSSLPPVLAACDCIAHAWASPPLLQQRHGSNRGVQPASACYEHVYLMLTWQTLVAVRLRQGPPKLSKSHCKGAKYVLNLKLPGRFGDTERRQHYAGMCLPAQLVLTF
jgi:hypothetical protein